MVLKLTEEEELELVKKFKEQGDMKAFKRLRISLRPLIRSAIYSALPNSNEVSAGQIAVRIDGMLPDILRDFDESKGVKLNTYITNSVRYRARNTVSESVLGAHVPRPEHTAIFRYRQAKRQAEIEYGMNPTPEQILKMNPAGLKNVEEVKRISQYDTNTLIGDMKFGDDDDGFVQFKDQFLKTRDTSKEQDASLLLDEMRQLQKELPEQDQKIIEEYIFNERTLTDTALRVGVTTSRVRTVTAKWKKKLKEKNIT